MPSAFQPCHIAPAPVTTSHLPGPMPRAASVQKGKDGGRSRGGRTAVAATREGDRGQGKRRGGAAARAGRPAGARGEPGPISELVPKPGPRRRHPGLASRGPNSSG